MAWRCRFEHPKHWLISTQPLANTISDVGGMTKNLLPIRTLEEAHLPRRIVPEARPADTFLDRRRRPRYLHHILGFGPALEVQHTEFNEIPLAERLLDIRKMHENIPALALEEAVLFGGLEPVRESTSELGCGPS